MAWDVSEEPLALCLVVSHMAGWMYLPVVNVTRSPLSGVLSVIGSYRVLRALLVAAGKLIE